MATLGAFSPKGIVVVAATAGASVTAHLTGEGDGLLIQNSTNGIAYVKVGTAATVAATTAAGGYDVVVLPGSRILVTFPPFVTYAAVILGAGATAGPVFLSRGLGSTH